MDGVSLNRISIARPTLAGGYATSLNDSLGSIQQDALRLMGPGGGAASAPVAAGAPFSGDLNGLLARIQQDAVASQQAGNNVRAQQLVNFAALLQGEAGNPEVAGLLARAYTSPGSSEGAMRLNQTLLGQDPNPGCCLLGMLAFDGNDSAQWRSGYPASIFTGGVTGANVVGDVVREIADPSKITQGNRQTCGAASVQILVAREAPAEYVRLVTSLAVQGAATVHGGQTIQRTNDWNFGGDGNRSLSSRLIQPAFMDLANGQACYNNAADVSIDTSGNRYGLLAPEMQTLLTDITSRPTQTVQVKSWNGSGWVPDPSQPDPVTRIADSTGKGWSVPVLLSVKPNQSYGHYEMVDAVSANGVTLLNPWGYQETISLDTFRQRLVAAFYQ